MTTGLPLHAFSFPTTLGLNGVLDCTTYLKFFRAHHYVQKQLVVPLQIMWYYLRSLNTKYRFHWVRNPTGVHHSRS
jgi:hypothetical protein